MSLVNRRRTSSAMHKRGSSVAFSGLLDIYLGNKCLYMARFCALDGDTSKLVQGGL